MKRRCPIILENAKTVFEQSFLFFDLHGDELHDNNVECAIQEGQCQRAGLLELQPVLKSFGSFSPTSVARLIGAATSSPELFAAALTGDRPGIVIKFRAC